jgi:uncharacterized protein (TIGR01777 family)
MRALVTGATGFVGRRLLARLEKPVVLSRNAAKAKQSLAAFKVDAYDWDAQNEPAPAEAFAGVDVVIHLAGEPVAEGRWTAAKKVRLRESRVAGTRNLVQTLAQLPQKPKVLVSASAVGYYGSRGDQILDESAGPEDDFLAEICAAWEAASHQARAAGIRVVNPRVGIVLGEGGGALSKMLTPFKLGLGGPLGNGKQWMPWIHIDDLVGLILHAVEHDELAGPMNGSAPNPVTNREFTKTLGKVLRRPTFFPPVPGFMLRLMLGEFGSVLLTSQRAIPKAALDSGYHFQYADLEAALRAIFPR